MTPRIDIEDMTDAQDEAPERIYAWTEAGSDYWRRTDEIPPDHTDVEYVRADLARAKIDHLKEICGYAIGQWEDWVRDQFEGTSMFAGAMADVEATRAAVRDSLFADLARPSQAGDERVARLVKAAKRVAWVFPCLNQTETDAMGELEAALAAMDTPKGGGDE